MAAFANKILASEPAMRSRNVEAHAWPSVAGCRTRMAESRTSWSHDRAVDFGAGAPKLTWSVSPMSDYRTRRTPGRAIDPGASVPKLTPGRSRPRAGLAPTTNPGQVSPPILTPGRSRPRDARARAFRPLARSLAALRSEVPQGGPPRRMIRIASALISKSASRTRTRSSNEARSETQPAGVSPKWLANSRTSSTTPQSCRSCRRLGATPSDGRAAAAAQWWLRRGRGPPRSRLSRTQRPSPRACHHPTRAPSTGC